jgi:hypothetical protein
MLRPVREDAEDGGGLKVGDRVRVTIRNRLPEWQPGERGTVTHGPLTSSGGTTYDMVAMDAGA